MGRIEIEREIIKWLVDFVEKPNLALGNWAPCPFARRARIDNKVKIIFAGKYLSKSVNRAKQLLSDNDVVVVCFDHNAITADYVQGFVINANKILMPQDFVILEDHPDSVEYVNNVKMNFGKCGLLLIQRLSKLNAASNQLFDKGYYDYWNSSEYNNVVAWRQVT